MSTPFDGVSEDDASKDVYPNVGYQSVDRPAIVVPQPPISRLAALNTENSWALIIGLTWYPAIVLISHYNLTPGHLYHWKNGDIVQTFTADNVMSFLLMMSFTIICIWVVHDQLGIEMAMYKHFILCAIVFVCSTIGSFDVLFDLGLGTAIWCIIFGLIFRMMFSDPVGFMPAEFYIKISIVLLAVNLGDIILIGVKAFVVAWVETICVLGISFVLGRYILRLNSDTAIMTAAGLSVCGTSAIVSVKETIESRDQVSKIIIFILTTFTIPLIPTIPLIGNALNFNNNTLGAWIGGSIDTTGAVIASASLCNPTVSTTAVIVKMIQNAFIGPIVILISVIKFRTVQPGKLWDTFPKFVLGFIVTGIITTCLPNELSKKVSENSFIISEWFSAISFVLIGYGIYLPQIPRELFQNSRILITYIIGQLLDIVSTAGVAYIMFTIIH